LAQLNSLIVTGDSRFLNDINGNLRGNADTATTATTATKATQDESGNNIKASYASSISISDHTITLKNKNGASLGTVTVPDSTTDNTKLPLAGGTMTGTLNCKANVYTDAANTGSLNMGNSNIYGVNAIYTADASEGAGEGINFYRDASHVDTLWMAGGDLLFVPNRALGASTTKADSQKVGRFTANPTSGQVVITDGTTGGMKSSGYTIAKSVPSDAVFTDTTYTGTGAISVNASTHVISTTAEANQNAFSNVKVGSTTVAADTKTDTLELVGSNVTLTPDATNDKVTIGITKANVTTALGESSTWSSVVSALTGDTTVTIPCTALESSSVVDVYTQNSSGTPTALNSVIVTAGVSAAITFDALTENTDFKIHVINV
jgi:hypothetical protein